MVIPLRRAGFGINRFDSAPFQIAWREESAAPIGFARLAFLSLFDVNIPGLFVSEDESSGFGVVRRRLPVCGASQIRINDHALGARVFAREQDRPALRVQSLRPRLPREGRSEEELSRLTVER